MVTIGLTAVTIVLGGLSIRCDRLVNKATLGVFWTAYAVVALVFAGVL